MTQSQVKDRLLGMLEAYVYRGPGGRLVGTGALLLLGGLPFVGNLELNKTLPNGDFVRGTLATAGTAWWVTAVCLVLGSLLIFAGLFLIFRQYQDQSRKRVIAIELRGLSQTLDSSIQNAIPRRVMGRREEVLIDVREQVQGTSRQQQDAVTEVNLIPRHLKTNKSGNNRDDLILYVGGLAPVPLLFLAGNLLAAESKINWLDWDRKALKWTSPADGVDLQSPPIIHCEEHLGTEALVAISISYPVDVHELKVAFPAIPLVEMKIEGAAPGHVVSAPSIRQIQQAFMDTIAKLQGKGVRKVHLVLAAPSVLSMQLGGVYAGRNMPALIIYQYQKAQVENPYPWGVEMPNSERHEGVYVTR